MKKNKYFRNISQNLKTMPPVLALLLLLIAATGCHETEQYPNDAYGNFDLLWKIIDEHYCFFEEKDIDWEAVGREYRSRIKPGITYDEYFNLCSEMLNELRDGHVNLVSRFNTSYYRKWWSEYPQDFNLRTLQENYLQFDYRQTSGISYKVMLAPDSIGYIYYPAFTYSIGETNLDYILDYFQNCKALIIDVRDNGGGAMTNVETLVARFISEKHLAGYIRHKTGPGHGEFSEPYPIEYEPAAAGHVMWHKPVAVLTNRSCFSAANDFVSVMKSLPNVRIVGARTGGGGGLPFSSEIPIGWSVRFSACPVTDAEGNEIEGGIEPSEGCACHSPADMLALGKDHILEFALKMLGGNASEPPKNPDEGL